MALFTTGSLLAQTKVVTGESERTAERTAERAAERAAELAAERLEREREYAEQAEKSKAIFSTPHIVTTAPESYVFWSNQGRSSSQLSMSKEFTGESARNEGSFDVDKDVRNITVMLSGGVKSGKIKIIITLPNGTVMKELAIDESADIQYNQNIRISEEEPKYFGKWKYSIESIKAEGKYRLSINSN